MAIGLGRRGSNSGIAGSTITEPLNPRYHKQALGLVRNLTSLYGKYRTDHKSKRSRFGYSLLGDDNLGSSYGKRRMDLESGQEQLLSTADHSPGDLELTPVAPPWVKVADQVKDGISKGREKLVHLQKLQQRRLLRVFDDVGSEGDIEVESCANAITQILYKGERGIKEIERFSTQQDADIILNLQRSLATSLTKLSGDFKAAQKHYMNEIKKRKAGGGALESPRGNGTCEILDAGFTEDQLLELEGVESQVEHRTQEINKIAKSITDLNLVFKELANLVVEQGTILDRIDYNMENVVKDVKEANQELQKAEETQKNSRIQKCILALVAFIILNLLIMTARA
jgi:syntaxin 16